MCGAGAAAAAPAGQANVAWRHVTHEGNHRRTTMPKTRGPRCKGAPVSSFKTKFGDVRTTKR